MNDTTTPQMVDGKQALLEFARGHHARFEHAPADLERSLRKLGFAVTTMDEDFVTVRGPLDTTTNVRTMSPFGGAVRVRHFELLKGLARLLEVGPPLWRDEMAQATWHIEQLAKCEPFQIPAREEFKTRQELEDHIEACQVCQPSHRLLAEAVSLGASRHGERHLQELVAKSHEDAAAAVAFYRSIRDSHRLPFMTQKPQRAKRPQEVTA